MILVHTTLVVNASDQSHLQFFFNLNGVFFFEILGFIASKFGAMSQIAFILDVQALEAAVLQNSKRDFSLKH